MSTGARIGQRVSRWREVRRFSGRALGEAAGKSHGYIKKLESGEIANPGLDTLDAIARVLGFDDFSALMGADPDAPVPGARATPQADDDLAARVERLERSLQAVGATPARAVDGANVVELKHLAVVSCGSRAGAREDGTFPIPREWVKGRDLFVVTAEGDCMAPEIPDGATLICEHVYQQERAPNSNTTKPPVRYVVWVEGYADQAPDLDALDLPPADGQARALSPAQLAEAQRLKAVGWTQARIAERFGVAPSTMSRALRGVVGRHLPIRRASPRADAGDAVAD